MAVKSMTGFGEGSARANGVSVAVELSSVNRKQLEVTLRLPPQFVKMEMRLQKIVQAHLSRGRVSGTVQIEAPAGEHSVQLNHPRAEAVIEELRASAKKLNLADDLSASLLLRVPGLLDVQTTELDLEEVFPLLEKALQSALKKLMAMRAREGRALGDDLSARLNALEGMLKEINVLAPSVVSARREKMFQGLEKLGVENLSSDERVLKEIALFGEKSDITEEIIRLESHLKQFRSRLRSAEPVGRELDFLVQEFLREVNTIGSKANDLKITEQVVAFKTELERIREQIQNVE